MRLFLLPVSTKRTLIYCERVPDTILASGAKPPLSERIIDRASKQWMTWEKAEKGWQKQLTVYGNKLFRRLPFEEWGLKSIPPATKQRLEDVDQGRMKFECVFPSKFVKEGRVSEILKKLATERQALHNQRMWTCIALMPVSAPFTLVPVIPNIPFFYLCFRAYSHYRALYGSRLLDHLVTKNLITSTPSSKLDEAYTAGILRPAQEAATATTSGAISSAEVEKAVSEVASRDEGEETMLLQTWNGRVLAETYELPEMEIEIERAVEQVEKAIKTAKEKAASAQPEGKQPESKSEEVKR